MAAGAEPLPTVSRVLAVPLSTYSTAKGLKLFIKEARWLS